MEVYFDNSATTFVSPEVINIVTKVMSEDFGNPSSKHNKGLEAEHYLRSARETICKILKVDEKEIFFTSGGTESNNMALIGGAMANQRMGKHIITTVIEHSSVLEPLKYLADQGFEITYLTVDGDGHINLDELRVAIRPDTILVSTMFVNNEVGAIQNVKAIGELIKSVNTKILYHVDAIQAFGKLEIRPKKFKIDLLSVSSHKFHGPKGVGFLYINSGVKIRPLILGGGQQKGMRSGTDNVPGVAGMALAAQIAYDNLAENTAHMSELKERLMAGLIGINEKLEADGTLNANGRSPVGEHIKINSREGGACHIVSVTFAPVKSEVMLHALEERGVYVSSGSACSSNRPGLSGTLQSIGLTPAEADCTIRFSFCPENTLEEVEYVLGVVGELLPKLSKFVAK